MTPAEFQETIKKYLIENGTAATFEAFASVIEQNRANLKASDTRDRFGNAAYHIRIAAFEMMGRPLQSGE